MNETIDGVNETIDGVNETCMAVCPLIHSFQSTYLLPHHPPPPPAYFSFTVECSRTPEMSAGYGEAGQEVVRP